METWLVLICVSEQEHGVAISQLPKLQGAISLSGLSKNVEKLTKNNLIEGSPNPVDKRYVEIRITSKGKKLLNNVELSLKKIEAGRDSKISPEIQEGMIKIVKIARTMNNLHWN
jgi:DNA-binding MarR family transcriptional regulator